MVRLSLCKIQKVKIGPIIVFVKFQKVKMIQDIAFVKFQKVKIGQVRGSIYGTVSNLIFFSRRFTSAL